MRSLTWVLNKTWGKCGAAISGFAEEPGVDHHGENIATTTTENQQQLQEISEICRQFTGKNKDIQITNSSQAKDGYTQGSRRFSDGSYLAHSPSILIMLELIGSSSYPVSIEDNSKGKRTVAPCIKSKGRESCRFRQ